MAITSGRSFMFAIRAASSHNRDPHLSPSPSSCSSSSSSPCSSSSHGILSATQRFSTNKQLKDSAVKSSNRIVAAAASGTALPLVTSGQQWLDKSMEEGILSLQQACLVAGMAGLALKAWGERLLGCRKLKFNTFSATQLQSSIEKGILDSRFSTLIAVAGSLVGSIVCFIDGCFLIMEAFFHYFHKMWQHATVDLQAEMIHLLIEAIDMFLVGTGLLNFGMAMYIMFVGSRGTRTYTNLASSGSNLAGIFYHMIHRPAMGTKWLYHAKAKLGHAVDMILQAGTVEKFAHVPVANGLDLACFAGAILLSSASVFLLSRLSNTTATSSSRSNSSCSSANRPDAAAAAEQPHVPVR